MKVAHIITGLDTGGSEMMLYRLLSLIDREEFESTVISMTDVGPVGAQIQSLGVPVLSLEMGRGIPNPYGILQLVRWLKALSPHVVQTWMYQADLAGGIAAKVAGNVPVAWGVHSTELDSRSVTLLKRAIVRACAVSSYPLPTSIVCCSEASRRSHADLGYAREKLLVIPNGADPSAYKPDPEAGSSLRRELSIPENSPLVGLVARFDTPKDHRNFVEAAALLHARRPEIEFILCGDGITWKNKRLSNWIHDLGFQECFNLLGRRNDIPRITAALDLATSSSSYGEAWPLVIGEAMACEVPCVVTDVGDSALIVGETGRVVPPKNPEALANAWYELLTMNPGERRRLGTNARMRIESHFSLSDTVKRYADLYRTLTRDGQRVC